ncbi:hypothetical protein V6N12_023916 [Hibiscus sabdariffa]|uniref:RNase H type-1 domain-containing protein n=1 Tax=Hibiscus sabdariffa TaxID=183260 RepID=A0ABR2FZA5_9ROSI
MSTGTRVSVPVRVGLKCKEGIGETVWTPPASCTVKFNVDGSYSVQRVGCGEVLGNYKGDVFAIFSGPVDCIGADFAELVAVRTTLTFFQETKEFGKSLLVIESDSQVVLKWLKDISSRPSIVDMIGVHLTKI